MAVRYYSFGMKTPLIVFLLLLVQHAVSISSHTARLTTTWGANAREQQNKTRAPTPPPLKGKICLETGDCFGLRNTTCLLTRDGKKRCLCQDLSVPINARCPVPLKGPNAECMKDDECVKGATCTSGNNTMPSRKTCQCLPNYYEDEDECSGGVMLATPSMVLMLLFHVLRGLQHFYS